LFCNELLAARIVRVASEETKGHCVRSARDAISILQLGKKTGSKAISMKRTRFLCRLAAVPTFYLATLVPFGVYAQEKPEVGTAASCHVEPVNYMGWQAQQASNPWVKLIFVCESPVCRETPSPLDQRMV
jgi:hypothetical protein